MPTLAQMLAQANAGVSPYILPRHVRWMEETNGEVRHSAQAMQFAMDVWDGVYKHERSGRYSPSSIAKCPRRVVLGFEGAPQAPKSAEDADLMMQGTVAHLHWQMEGISAGYLHGCEEWVTDGDRLGGSVDGLTEDGIFEYKNMRAQMFMRWVTRQEGGPAPNPEHVLQLAAYFKVTGRTKGFLLYQNRDSGDCYEFVVRATAELEDKLDERLETLDGFVDIRALPPVLDDCLGRTGYTYKTCPVNDACLKHHRAGR